MKDKKGYTLRLQKEGICYLVFSLQLYQINQLNSPKNKASAKCTLVLHRRTGNTWQNRLISFGSNLNKPHKVFIYIASILWKSK